MQEILIITYQSTAGSCKLTENCTYHMRHPIFRTVSTSFQPEQDHTVTLLSELLGLRRSPPFLLHTTITTNVVLVIMHIPVSIAHNSLP